MRIAIIDLGTNSVRFDVHQLKGKKVKSLHREKWMVRLGQGVFIKKKLDPAAVLRTLNAFVHFKKLSDQMKVEKIVAFGTSALRDAKDRERFFEKIKAATGIEIKLISGVDEARLIARGILSNENRLKGKVAFIDIGGGSTEITVCRNEKILHSASFQLGTARLTQLFLQKSPPEANQIEDARNYIRNELFSEMDTGKWPKINLALGSSGTIRTLSRMLKKGPGESYDAKKIKGLVSKMSGLNPTELLGLNGMEARRVDMILAGAVIYEEVLLALGAKKARATEYSLRDGILDEENEFYKKGSKTRLALHLQDIHEISKKFGIQSEHQNRMIELAENLFKKLKPIHKLSWDWFPYLAAAVILRDVGEHLSSVKHEEHSYYIVKNADLPAMEGWEAEMIAELCKHHEDRKIELKKIPFGKNKERRAAFMSLVVLLKMVDALDGSQQSRVQIKQIRILKKAVTVRFKGRSLTGLEALSLELLTPLFKKSFKRKLFAIRQS